MTPERCVAPNAGSGARERRRGRSVRALLALCTVAAVVFFAAPADRAMAQTGPTTSVNIPDLNLRAALETQLGKTAGATITRAEMAAHTGFLWGSPPRRTLRLDHADWNSDLVPTPQAPTTVIRGLTGLEYLTAIQGLSMTRHRITDLRPLAGLTEMRRLWLDENLISDLSPLRGLPLDQLSIKLNPVRDLSPLAGMVGLANFNCDRCQISDISALAGLTRLTYLDLQNNYIRSIEPLRRVNDLAEVFLSDNDIEDLSPLENRNLRTLTAAGNRITDLSPLRNSLVMETLDLNLNEGLRDVSVVERMVALKVLRLDGTDVRDLSPLVRNNGLGSGDQVYLRNVPNLNADAAQHVATLKGRGVSVFVNDPLKLDRTVRNVRVTPGVERLTVAWIPVTPTAAFTPQGYRVYWWSGHQDRSSRYTPPQHHDGTADTSSYTIPNLTPGTRYKVQILPYPPWPGGEFSAIVVGRPLAALRVEGEGGGEAVTVTPGVESLAVSWNRVDGAGDYKVQWKSGDEGYDPANRQARTGGGDKTSYTIPELTAGTEYTIRVIATTTTTTTDDGADGPPSDEATGTPLAAAPTVVPGVESLTVSWNQVDGAGDYKVQWKSGEEDYDPDARQARTGGGDKTSYTIRDLTAGVEYTVRVIATTDDGADGPPSDEATGTPLAGVPGVPASEFKVDVEGALQSLKVSWDAVRDAISYRVRWRQTAATEEFAEADAACLYVRERESCVDVPPSGSAGSDPKVTWTIRDLEPDVKYTVEVTPRLDDQSLGDPRYKDGTPIRKAVVTIMGEGAVAGVGSATVVEGEDAELRVMLDEPSRVPVTVAWRTEDDDTAKAAAKAGEDYRATMAGRLTIEPRKDGATLRVLTLQDRRVEPAETFRVRLTEVRLAEATYEPDPEAASATVTIVDDDTEPARGRALEKVLAGMGRWVAADAVEVIGGRFTGGEAVEAQVGLGGWTLPLPGIGPREPGRPGSRPVPASEWTPWTPDKETTHPALSVESLSRSRFNLPLGQREAGAAEGGLPGLRVWGQGSVGGFDGRPEAGFRMDGEVAGGYLGADYRPRHDALVGVALARSRGDVDYEIDDVTTGAVDLELTSVLPYAHWSPRAGLGVWGLLGAGWGDAELEDEAGKVETDLEMRMLAAGMRQDVATWREIDVAVKADAFLAELTTDAKAGLPKAGGGAERLRLRLEGRMQRATSPVSQLTPSVEIGGRWDGGDADTGMGLEVGGGLAYAHETLGLEVEARGRYLLAHRESAFDEWGGSLAARLDPGQAGRGPWMTFAPGWGAEGSRMAQMWDGREVFRAPGGGGEGPELSPDRVDLEVGWGAWRRVGGAGLVTPWAGLSTAGAGRYTNYKLGARMEAGSGMSLDLENRLSGAVGYEVMLYGRLDW